MNVVPAYSLAEREGSRNLRAVQLGLCVHLSDGVEYEFVESAVS
jgi:hypothetical protein